MGLILYSPNYRLLMKRILVELIIVNILANHAGTASPWINSSAGRHSHSPRAYTSTSNTPSVIVSHYHQTPHFTRESSKKYRPSVSLRGHLITISFRAKLSLLFNGPSTSRMPFPSLQSTCSTWSVSQDWSREWLLGLQGLGVNSVKISRQRTWKFANAKQTYSKPSKSSLANWTRYPTLAHYSIRLLDLDSAWEYLMLQSGFTHQRAKMVCGFILHYNSFILTQ